MKVKPERTDVRTDPHPLGQGTALALGIFGHVIWGLTAYFTILCLRHATVMQTLGIRFTIAVLILLVFLLTGRTRISLKGKHPAAMIYLMMSEPVYFLLETYGLALTNATVEGVIVALVPVVAIGLAALFLHEYPTRRQAVFSFLPVIGAILVTAAGSSLGVVKPLGVVLLFLCCLSSSVYKVANKKASEDFTAFERTFLILLASSIAFTIMSLVELHGDVRAYFAPLGNREFLVSVNLLAAFASVGAHLMVNRAVQYLTVAKTAVLSILITVVSTFSGVVLLGEPMNAWMWVGAIFIIYGVFEVTRADEKTGRRQKGE